MIEAADFMEPGVEWLNANAKEGYEKACAEVAAIANKYAALGWPSTVEGRQCLLLSYNEEIEPHLRNAAMCLAAGARK